MKKIFLPLIISSLVILLTLFSPSLAKAQTLFTLVTGMIEDGSGNGVSGASVHVVCNSNAIDTVSTGTGSYSVNFSPSVCADGDTVNVSASMGGQSGANSGEVDNFNAMIDLAIVNVTIPEFGLITGAFALIASAGSYIVLKRRAI